MIAAATKCGRFATANQPPTKGSRQPTGNGQRQPTRNHREMSAREPLHVHIRHDAMHGTGSGHANDDGAPPSLDGDEAFWRQALDGAPQILEVVTDLPRVSPAASPGARAHWAVSGATRAKLEALAAGAGTSLGTVLLAAYTTLLARYSRGDDIVVGLPVVHPDGRRNTVAVRITLPAKDAAAEVQEGAAFCDICQLVAGRVAGALAHADLPFARVCEMLGAASASSTPVTQALFSCAPEAGSSGGGWATATPVVAASLPGDFTVTHDLDLRVASVTDDGIVGALYYRHDLFIRESAAQMASTFQVSGMTGAPGSGKIGRAIARKVPGE